MVVTNKHGQTRNLGEDASNVVDAILDNPNWEGTYLNIVTDYNTQKPQLDRAISIVARNRGLRPEKILEGLDKVIAGLAEGFKGHLEVNAGEVGVAQASTDSKNRYAYDFDARDEKGNVVYTATEQEVAEARSIMTSNYNSIEDDLNNGFFGSL